ncbi:MAG: glycosyltransferase family 61 protein [Flavobacteriales bacterium]|nr:glycosyltransferase family 61 protein [Flavobacteriales bacterium]
MSYLIPPTGFSASIDYRPPVNMRPEWAHLFRPEHEYKKVRLGVRQLRNVFVNHYGLVIDNGLLVKGCAPNIGSGSYDDGFYYPHWRKAMEQMLVSRFGRSIPSKRLDDGRTYLLIHSPWFSYYFWITECIPRLLTVREHLKDVVLIYPEDWGRLPYVQETLSLFPELQLEVVPSDVHLFVKDLVMPEVKPWTPMFIPEQVMEVRNLIFDAADARAVKAPFSGNIHLSRLDARYKNFANPTEVTDLLDEFGFQHVTMTGLSIFEQAAMMRTTDNLVSITGAGMSNFTFLQKGSNVLDVTNAGYLHHAKYKFHFKKLTDIVGANYRVLFCAHANDPDVIDYFLQNLVADIPVMRTELEAMMS